MIVPMKKVSVITQAQDAGTTISRLRRLGLLHVEHQQPPRGDDVASLQNDLSLVDACLRILSEPEFLQRPPPEVKNTPGDWRFTARHIIDSHKRIDQLKEYSRNLSARIAEWQAWGDFEPQAFQELAQKNIFVRFYQIPLKEVKHIPSSVIVKNIRVIKGVAYCAVVSREKVEIPFKEIPLPKMSLSRMESRLVEDGRVTEAIRADIKKHSCLLDCFFDIRRSLAKELEFHEALRGMGGSEAIKYVTGYIPDDAADKVLSLAREEKWGILVADPSAEDQVPTLLRNPAWVSLIKPVFKLIEVVPGYHELDISLWFLLFLSAFFGILIGDAGYGLIYILLTFWAHCKFGNKVKEKSVFILSYILSACAIIWGVCTMTIFGQEWLRAYSIKPFIPALTDDKQMRSLCFLIGAMHLTIAHIWRVMVQIPAITALADVGWILILWAAFFLARLLILGIQFPAFGLWLLIPGMVLVVFFSNPRKNVLRGAGAGLGTLALNLMNNFTDIVSYIRLFAVGLATVALADAFNVMAQSLGVGGVIGGVIRSLILIAGHGLNIILGPMSVLVHGVRLNVLEFCTHLDVKWSGFAYKPLQEEAV